MAHTVLVVDDDPGIRIAIKLKLKSQGFHVLEAGDGNEALAVLGSEDIDLSILDVGMPGMDGYTLCEHINKGERTQSMPVIILTAQDAEMPAGVAERIRVSRFLMKPFSPRELVQTVSDLLDTQEG
jgi:DNA-binding response OmpR family regulator